VRVRVVPDAAAVNVVVPHPDVVGVAIVPNVKEGSSMAMASLAAIGTVHVKAYVRLVGTPAKGSASNNSSTMPAAATPVEVST
jgi:hypothetical protein